MDALVTDVHLRSAVTGVRALGRSGLDVLALGSSRSAAGCWSRYAAARAVGPDVKADPAAFAQRIGELAAERGPLVVYPGWEEAIDAVVDNWDSFPTEAILPYPGTAPLRALRDKSRLGERARECGMGSPEVYAEGIAAELAGAEVTFPVIVKPVRPGGELATAAVADTARDLERLLAALNPSERVILQERAAGELISLELVMARDGTVAARFQQRATRTWPEAAGSISHAVSVEPDVPLLERAAALLRDAGYWGLAELDFIQTDRGPLVIDCNPRFYSCMPLSLACGLNLPAVWHSVVTGGAVPGPEPYRLGVTYRWLEGDLMAAIRGHPGRLATRAPKPRVGGAWAGDDPVPGALLVSDGVGIRLRRRLPGPPAETVLRRVAKRTSVVLCHHGVAPSHAEQDPFFLRVQPAAFRRQVELLLGAGFEFVTVADFAERAGGGEPPPGLAALSFDDAMGDNYSHALPILRELGVPATVYVTTGLIGKPNPWLQTAEPTRMMTPDELNALVAEGWELGAHTVTHPDMEQLGQAECLHEMTASSDEVERITGVRPVTFAYPFCRYGPEAMAAAREAGFTCAVTCAGRGSWAPFEMKRALIHGKDGIPSFVLKVADRYQDVFEAPPMRVARAATRPMRRRIRRARGG